MVSLLQGCSSRLRSTDRTRPGAHPCLSVHLSFAVGEATAGKASRSLAQHIPGSGGIEGVRGAAGGVIGDLTRARIALDERGQKLGELDERTASMMASAEAFSKHAHEVGVLAPTPWNWELPTLPPSLCFPLGKPSALLSLHPVMVLGGVLMSTGVALFLLPNYQNAKNKVPLHTPSFHVSRNEHPLLASEFRTWHFSSCLSH